MNGIEVMDGYVRMNEAKFIGSERVPRWPSPVHHVRPMPAPPDPGEAPPAQPLRPTMRFSRQRRPIAVASARLVTAYAQRHYMPEEPSREQREHDLTIHVFTISAGLVGVCLTAIGLLRILTHHTQITTVADELLAADAVLFMVCCFRSFWSFKTETSRRRLALRRVIDWLFMVALFFMVVVCSLIAYAVI